jgi:hypothetical protein
MRLPAFFQQSVKLLPKSLLEANVRNFSSATTPASVGLLGSQRRSPIPPNSTSWKTDDWSHSLDKRFQPLVAFNMATKYARRLPETAQFELNKLIKDDAQAQSLFTEAKAQETDPGRQIELTLKKLMQRQGVDKGLELLLQFTHAIGTHVECGSNPREVDFQPGEKLFAVSSGSKSDFSIYYLSQSDFEDLMELAQNSEGGFDPGVLADKLALPKQNEATHLHVYVVKEQCRGIASETTPLTLTNLKTGEVEVRPGGGTQVQVPPKYLDAKIAQPVPLPPTAADLAEFMNSLD